MFSSGMNFGLGEEIDALRETVARWAQDKLAPLATDIDRNNDMPRDLWTQMGELGLLGMTADPDFGGTGFRLSWPTRWPWRRSAGHRPRWG
jgi:isovaleryl-CoA dehydrogenase